VSSSRCIALIGPRASGKTTLAKALGDRLEWEVLDGDELLAAEVGLPAGDYLEQAGEAAFREIEERITLTALAEGESCILALGGGAILSGAISTALQAQDVLVIFLEASAGCLVERLRSSRLHRPKLLDLPLDEEVEEVLRRRRPLYDKVADLRLDTFSSNVDACCTAILDKMISSA